VPITLDAGDAPRLGVVLRRVAVVAVVVVLTLDAALERVTLGDGVEGARGVTAAASAGASAGASAAAFFAARRSR
jgi:hypothetical protein